MIRIYRSLSRPELYDTEVELKLKILGSVFPFRMRIGDCFVLGEILHERQYRVRSTVPTDALIVDAGANVGIAAIWFLACFPKSTLHAFEPAAENFRFLEANIASLDRVHVFQAAVGKEADTLSLVHADSPGTHSLVGVAADHAETEMVPVVALADHMEAHDIERIDLLKLDIEGSERDALAGLGDRIKDVSVIVGEVHETLIDADEFYSILDQSGFRVCWKRVFREGRKEKVHGFEAARDG